MCSTVGIWSGIQRAHRINPTVLRRRLCSSASANNGIPRVPLVQFLRIMFFTLIWRRKILGFFCAAETPEERGVIMIKHYFIAAVVTIGLIGGSLAVSASPAEAQWQRGRCHRVWHHGHWETRCNRGWGNSRSYPRSYSQRYYRSYPRSYSRRDYRSYSRPYSRPYDPYYSRRYR